MWLDYSKERDFSTLIGVTLARIDGLEPGSDEVKFVSVDGREWLMKHNQGCCETVSVEDVCGDVSDLIGCEILKAEESTNAGDFGPKDARHESFTWTFYRIQTERGLVVIRWYGTSSGWYSEDVTFYELNGDSDGAT